MKQTKIVATLGPATNTKDVLSKLFKRVDVIRLNGSHYRDHSDVIKDVTLIRDVSKQVDKNVGILDLQGQNKS